MMPDADASDEIWQVWAANELGMNIREPGAICQNPKIYSYIFKHRFPLYTRQASMKEVLSAKDWHFQAELDYTATCVCTNFICRLHLMRNVKLGIDKIIGKDCFDRYFAEEDEHWRTSRELRNLEKRTRANALKKKGKSPLRLTSMTFKETFDAGCVEVEWTRDNENLSREWHDFRTYQMACSTIARFSERTLLLKNESKTFVTLATRPLFVRFVQDDYKGTSTQYADFSTYLLALRTENAMKHSIFTFSGETFEEMSRQPQYRVSTYFTGEEWKNFTDYVTERTLSEEDDVCIRSVVEANDSLNNYDKNERDAHIDKRRKRRKEAVTRKSEECDVMCQPCDTPPPMCISDVEK